MKEAIEKGKVDTLDLSDEFELDTKTVASAIKGYFSKQLGEPLLTYQLHEAFIEAASESKIQQSSNNSWPLAIFRAIFYNGHPKFDFFFA